MAVPARGVCQALLKFDFPRPRGILADKQGETSRIPLKRPLLTVRESEVLKMITIIQGVPVEIGAETDTISVIDVLA